MPKVHRLDKLPKRKVTVDEILSTDDLNETLDFVLSQRLSMDEFIGIWANSKGEAHWYATRMQDSRFVYLLEIVKKAILSGERTEE